MQLTLFTDYALRTLIYLSWHPERPCTSEEVASFFAISHDHLIKVTQHLARHEYVHVRRGRHGGATLARPATEIRLGAILRDLEDTTLLDCVQKSGVCVIESGCKLKRVLAEGERRLLAYFDEFTLADVAGPRPEARPSLTPLPAAGNPA